MQLTVEPLTVDSADFSVGAWCDGQVTPGRFAPRVSIEAGECGLSRTRPERVWRCFFWGKPQTQSAVPCGHFVPGKAVGGRLPCWGGAQHRSVWKSVAGKNERTEETEEAKSFWGQKAKPG